MKKTLPLIIALMMGNAYASELSVIHKDGLVELDCHKPTPKEPIANAKIFCEYHGYHDIEANGKSGIVGKDGTLITTPIYDDLLWLSDKIVQVEQDGKYALLDITTGKLLTPLEYDDIGLLKDGLINVKKGDNAGYVDNSGKVVIPLKYGDTFSFENGLAIVVNHGNVHEDTYRMGVIDKKGHEILPPIYRGITFTEDSILFTSEDRLDGMADLTGKVIIKPEYTNLHSHKDGYAFFSIMGLSDMVGFLDKTGKEIIEPQYIGYKSHTKVNDKVLFTVAKQQGVQKRWGVVDEDNRTVIDFNYVDLRPQHINNTYIATNEDGKDFILNDKGEQIGNAYDEIIGFYGDVNLYRTKHHYGLININGDELTGAVYDDIKFVRLEESDDKPHLGYMVKQGEKYGFLAPDGKVILPSDYDDIIRTGKRLFVQKDEHIGVFTVTGKPSLPVIHAELRPLADDYTKVKIDGVWYLIDPSGNNLGKTSAPEYPWVATKPQK